jgi:hypothetical protein
MAEATLEAPPSAEVRVPASPIPAPPPAPTKEIKVSTMTGGDRGPTSTAPKPGSAKAEMLKALNKKAGVPEPPPEPEVKKQPVKKEEQRIVEPGEETEEETPVPPGTKPETKTDPEAKPKEKVNPWKISEQYKAQVAKLEKELADIKASPLAEQERTKFSEQLKKFEERNKELEDEIRFVNYEKSSEFKSKYQEPYEKAWQNAMVELSEISVLDPSTGEQRSAGDKDLLELVNLPLGPARARADEVFGQFANDMMAHRKEIRKLFEARTQALGEARKSGTEREKQLAQQQEIQAKATASVISQAWEKANKIAMEHERYGKYFSTVEGDQEVNQRLAKGFEMVDRAFNEDVRDPRLNAEQRAGVVKRLAAVRNRAAAFGRLVYENEKLSTQLANLTKELEGYKQSEPGTGGGQSKPTQPAFGSAKDSLVAALHKIAKPY